MSFYESTFIARQDISSQDAEKLADEFSDILKKNGGKVIKKEYWGLRNLAYKINKARKGHYIMLGIEAPAEAVKEIERKYNIHEDVIRNLTIKVDKISKEQSAIMREYGSDERPIAKTTDEEEE